MSSLNLQQLLNSLMVSDNAGKVIGNLPKQLELIQPGLTLAELKDAAKFRRLTGADIIQLNARSHFFLFVQEEYDPNRMPTPIRLPEIDFALLGQTADNIEKAFNIEPSNPDDYSHDQMQSWIDGIPEIQDYLRAAEYKKFVNSYVAYDKPDKQLYFYILLLDLNSDGTPQSDKITAFRFLLSDFIRLGGILNKTEEYWRQKTVAIAQEQLEQGHCTVH